MKVRISSIIFIILIFTFLSSQSTLAKTKEIYADPSSTYFSFFENYLIAYHIIDTYNNRVLAAHTKALPHLTIQIQNQPVVDIPTYLLSGINAYRAMYGLAPVKSNPQTCAFAAIRAKEITTGFNHEGFYNRVNSHTIPYTKWSHATENIAEAQSYKMVVTMWANSPGHAANMRDNTPYVCVRQSGNYYAYEGMRL